MPPTVILVRHAQALHNVENKSPDFPLSFLFCNILTNIYHKTTISMIQIPKDFDVGLIIVSPSIRTIETALLAFGDLIEKGVPIVAHAGWQENSLQPCDTGTALPTLATLFPQVDFRPVDPLYPDKTSAAAAPVYGYTRQAIVSRGQTVLRELRARPEKAVVVVSHSGFLRAGVTGRYFMNADFRVFEFLPEGEGDGLRLWEGMEAGGMGWSWDRVVPLGEGLSDAEGGVDGVVDGVGEVVDGA
ncbi:histidine phosphatase superfamily [Chaetomium fimeti]|uniref:Histidine phosphatase superfamily n=1 Tax=Chaetomium fimeti TaxID=1854472 RepID=A0AAE0H8E0_9PEZI|nr:histidine phosphatase superfamily [Chaetomium fimeti]